MPGQRGGREEVGRERERERERERGGGGVRAFRFDTNVWCHIMKLLSVTYVTSIPAQRYTKLQCMSDNFKLEIMATRKPKVLFVSGAQRSHPLQYNERFIYTDTGMALSGEC